MRSSSGRSLLSEKGPGSLGFYTTGQLFLEEYYTLAIVARAGLGTNHLDGNTRLCTATAGEALKESFGCDGQPGSYDDIHHADVIALFGHNVAETRPVLWRRILDRLEGPLAAPAGGGRSATHSPGAPRRRSCAARGRQ